MRIAPIAFVVLKSIIPLSIISFHRLSFCMC